MKVTICKILDGMVPWGKIRKLIADEANLADDRLKVFCADEAVRQKLAEFGIVSEVLADFQHHTGIDDESGWEMAYRISDELMVSAESDDRLKHSGINFLTMEYHIVKYVYAVKLSRFINVLKGQKGESAVLILTAPYTEWLADMNSSSIKTVRYGSNIKYTVRTMVLLPVLYAVHSLLTYFKDYINNSATRKKPAANRKQSGILFIVSTPLYTRPALSIAEACQKNGLFPNLATDDMTALPLLRPANITYLFKPPFSLVHIISSSMIARRLKRHIGTFYSNQDEFSAACLCRETLLADLPGLCHQAVFNIRFLDRLMKRSWPDLLCIMPQSGLVQILAASLANKHKIPVLACSAAWETSDATSFRRHLHADRIAVMGERTREIYLKSGLNPDRVVTTGVAHFDRLFQQNKSEDDRVLRQYAIDPSKPIALFTTDGIGFSETERMLTGVIEAILKMENFQLVVKVHPREAMENYQILAEKCNSSRIIISRDIDLYALIRNCKLLMTKYSTTAIEAMMIGKPVIVINLSGQPTPVPYAEEGAAFGVYKYEDIAPAIQKVLYNEEIRASLKAGSDRFVRAWAGEPDGKASLRIVNLMKEMIESNKTRKETHAG